MCRLKKRHVFAALPVLFALFCSIRLADATENLAWQSLTTKHTIIHYQSDRDLGKFCANVKYGSQKWGLKVLFSHERSDNILKDIVGKKTDDVFEKVQRVLGMLKKMEKVHIKFYRDKAQLDEAYERIYHRPCDIRAWYRHENNTVYIRASDIKEGVLAHELTHAIVDHYLAVRPPRATAEILARYVDKNLDRNTSEYDTPEPSQSYND
jgi:hypothetical protein